MSPLSTVLAKRFGVRWVVATGLALMGSGLLLLLTQSTEPVLVG
jgi:hypothetical protein